MVEEVSICNWKKYQASGLLWCQVNQWLDLRRDLRSSEGAWRTSSVMLSPTESTPRERLHVTTMDVIYALKHQGYTLYGG